MAKEIERKFLVTTNTYREKPDSVKYIKQAYLSTNPDATVRIRITDREACLTVKSRTNKATRDEWEYMIPTNDAKEMIARCTESRIIEKKRYKSGRWEIDEFHGQLEGLVIAEIELIDENESITLPSYIGKEVTGDIRYYNSSLSLADELPPFH